MKDHKNVVIFGAGGQDGPYLAALCQERGHTVYAWGKSAMDVSNEDAVWHIIDDLQPDLVFHLAARSTIAIEAAAENHAAIGTGTLNILEAVRRISPRTRVFLAGSALQFENRGEPIGETDPLVSGSVYAAARNYALALARHYRTLGVKVYFGFLFHHDSPRRPPGHVARDLADAARRAAAGERVRIKIGRLSMKKEWTFAGDTVAAMLALVSQDEIFEANIGSGIAHPIAGFARACFRAVNLDWRDYVAEADPRNSFLPPPAGIVANPARILSLGWHPTMTMEQLAGLMVGDLR